MLGGPVTDDRPPGYECEMIETYILMGIMWMLGYCYARFTERQHA